MLFNSIEYMAFLPAVLLLYWALRGRVGTQNLLLLCASYFFYGWWDVRFLFLIAITTVVDFNTALLIGRGTTALRERIQGTVFILLAYVGFILPQAQWNPFATLFAQAGLATTLTLIALIWLAPSVLGRLSDGARRKGIMTFSILVNLGILAFFKYFNFFTDSFAELYTSVFGVTPSMITLSIVLPVGISFYTFQSMSYTIDVYRKQLEPSPSIIDFGAYLSFFPQLVAGPIERGKSLLPQFQQERTVTREMFGEGIWLIFWGLFKKVVIADQLAIVVNGIFGDYDTGSGLGLPDGGGLLVLLGIYAFAFQIYADFSGYSDIARGSAKLMGFNLMLNFNLPYISTNPSEFWLRWHISLSSWLRDYLYIPLGGNRNGKFATYRNLFLTMLLGGLWHGASWTFVLWGAYQGTILVIYRLLGKENAGADSTGFMRVLHIAWMFQLTCLGWLIFRAQNVETITTFLTSMAVDMRVTAASLDTLWTLLFYITPLLVVQALQIRLRDLHFTPRLHWFANFNIWLFVLLGIVVLGSTRPSEFIYFAF